jgi:hypothetical protein
MISTFCDKREYIESDGAKLTRYLQVPVEDSMKFTFTFMYNGEWSNQKYPITNLDVVFKFYTEENPDKVFTASKSGSTTENCLIDTESSTIRVLMNEHGLGVGKLICKMTATYNDLEMPSGKGTVTRTLNPKISLVENLEQGRWMMNASEYDNFSIVVKMPKVDND